MLTGPLRSFTRGKLIAESHGTDQFRAAAPSEQLESSNPKGPEMRKVIVNEFMSLDGVAQAPGGADPRVAELDGPAGGPR
jgi:hypothetical protein